MSHKGLCRSVGLLMMAVTISACGEKEQASFEKEGVETVLPPSVAEVSVMTLKKRDFNHELVSNGKIKAEEYADLKFRTTSEPLAKIYVKNGDKVTKGQKIAELDQFELKNKLAQAQNAFDQSVLEMQDVLIGQGYAPDRTDLVPEDVMKLAKVKSGYEQSKANWELAEYDLQHAVLTAPFDGVVANLFDKRYNFPDASKPFCRVISSSGMEAEFTVLESELPLIKRGDRVDVSPYAAIVPAQKGQITEINPLVDENGMVRVKARVSEAGKLFDGMNVRVTVKRSVPGQLVIPKTAVVLRSGKQVVFTLEDGKAMWNYVQTGLENMTEYTVSGDGMKEGTEIIVSGNVNLAHETPVKVIGDMKR